MRKVLSLFAALAILMSVAPTSVLAAYYGTCGTPNHSSAHLFRGNYPTYTAVQATVVSRVVTPCTGTGGASFVLPANIGGPDGHVIQLGYGREGSDAANFLVTKDDQSRGVLHYYSVPGRTFAWNHTYRFTIAQSIVAGIDSWTYTIEDLTDVWSYSFSYRRTWVGISVWYQVESYDANSMFGAASTNVVTITPMKYKYNANTAWTTLTGDTAVAWDGPPGFDPPPSWWKAAASAPANNNYVSVFQAWTVSH